MEINIWKLLTNLAFITPKPALLQPKKPFPVTKLEDVAGCLKYDGEPATLEDMEDAIHQGVEVFDISNYDDVYENIR
ncbi:hypothetical protein A0J48_000050 [Sphaerospermopsis aphanizomenoides BCCUSP55]|uniref:hypothetical protein n=1 Tax=Sphaerospermopsis aphanizomenoides TaxID=459663 RepID=UPI0019081BA8|nr:hypothetical protein [Sphaerospermopsis aphanizomenoides]MBK1985956.1 hypothetical protein [Sphaerospermopsis aphanizomenoides BCCUSP55]